MKPGPEDIPASPTPWFQFVVKTAGWYTLRAKLAPGVRGICSPLVNGERPERHTLELEVGDIISCSSEWGAVFVSHANPPAPKIEGVRPE